MEKLDYISASLPECVLYPRMEGSYEQQDLCWERWEAAQSLFLVKAKIWIKSDETL